MKLAPVAYLRADSRAHAVYALAQQGSDARVLAGGQSLMAVLAMRLAEPSCLVDISRTADLQHMQVKGGHLTIGSAVTQSQVEWRVSLAREVPLLALALPWISHFQIRNRGTVCGSLAHADPSAELPLVLATLGGTVLLASERGERRVAAQDFFTGMLQTARAPDELLAEADFPCATPGTRYGFSEFGLRRGDFAITAVACAVSTSGIRFCVGGVDDQPRVFDWPLLEGSALDDALNEAAWSLNAADDPHASAKSRRQLVRSLGKKIITGAIA